MSWGAANVKLCPGRSALSWALCMVRVTLSGFSMQDPEPFICVRDARPIDSAWGNMVWPPLANVRLVGHIAELVPCIAARDAPLLFAALDHDAVWQHLAGRPRDFGAYAKVLEKHIAEGRFPWIVRLLRAYAGMPAGAVIGTSSYLNVSARDARLEIGATAYTPAAWSTRVNPDTKLLLLTHAFEALGAARVELKTDVRNTRSQMAIARLGARYEGTLRRHMRRDDGTLRDTILFSIIAEEWPAVRERLLARASRPDAK
jgi:RimJ/RimL family protein N-acetyltransferase